MTRDDLIARLLALPEQIQSQENLMLIASNALAGAKYTREFLVAELLLQENSPIDGKNAELRAAQIALHFTEEDQHIGQCGRALEEQRIALRRLENDFRAVRTTMQFLAGETER